MGTYKVKEGDCLSSIAQKHGLFWEAVWNHPKNSKLKSKRKDPNVLFPGDKIFVPDKEKRQEEGATESTHRFRALGVPAKMKVRMLQNEEPRANEKYRLYIDDMLRKEGTTDSDGFIEEPVPADCRTGKIVMIDEEGNEEYYPFDFGSVDPLDTDEGLRKRLFSLGFYGGENADDQESLDQAVREFQQNEGLEPTGSIDSTTLNKIKELFGE